MLQKKGTGGQKEKKVEGEKKDGGVRKEDGPITVVLKIDMHCDGCAQKVRRSVKGFKGVEGVATDLGGNTLTVIGKVDPVDLRDRVEGKMHRKVDLVSPVNSGQKEKIPKGGGNGNGQKNGNENLQKPADKKPKEPAMSTVVLKIRLHCEGCIQRIRRHISKVKGVESVSIDSEKDLVTVKGTMDAKVLPELLTAKLKRGVEIVNPKKEEGGDKEKGEKKKADGGKGGKKGGEEGQKDAAAMTEGDRMEYYGGGYGNYPYRMEMLHAPQLFSDENPNACCIM
ncbi:Heavy metal-associated isoprenylated plant protein 26 [Apostasia shenzhenica]|uniref:Heavy metal-associated isoprenylated plant protein 26 n=1 Tax=Apostasia shenzhenica TaxID=1088818 RepID=A0A2I0AUH7_9ASPA|nr:Heavy metal-associated isoprenylated plant protein 26 [Apostasia shenzhenica]